MIKKTITFENHNGEKESEDFYFNMSKGELVKMQMAAIDQRTESFQDKLEKIGKDLNGKALIDVVDEIVLGGIGQRTTDGKKFVKNAAISEDFKSSEAYSELIVELCTNEQALIDFINGLMPANLREEVKRETAQSARERSESQMQGYQQKPVPTVQKVAEVPTVIEEAVGSAGEVPSAKSVIESMSRDELEALVAQQRQGALQ